MNGFYINFKPWKVFSTAFFMLIFIETILFSKKLIVGKEYNLNSITKALKIAKPGDTIIVNKGIYYGNIVIGADNLTLIGKDWPVIQGDKKGCAVTIKGKYTIFKGFIVKGGGFSLLKDEAGIKLINADYSKVINNKLYDNLHGIYLQQSSHCLIIWNYIHGRDYEVQENRGNGIHFWNSNFCVVKNNELEYTRDGFYVSFSHYCHLDNNYIHNTRYGIHYMYSNHNYFDGNILFNNVAGMALMFGRYFYFKRNIVAHNRGFRAYGILWQSAEHAYAKENIVYDNSIGMYFDKGEFSIIENNWVINNDIGVVLLSNSEVNEFYNNNFINNITLLQIRGGKASEVYFYSKKLKRGNYWSDYRGYDLNNDGIGDVEFSLFRIYDDLTADYPEFRIFYFSPLVKAIELAEKAFPILEVPEFAVDKYPLIKPVNIKISPSELLKYEKFSKLIPVERGILMFISFLILTICFCLVYRSLKME